MITNRRDFIRAVGSSAGLALAAGRALGQSAATEWYRGNLHTHTINSDGDSPPYDVMAWYKRNGYQFLVITDHNTFTDPVLTDTNPNDRFLLIGGEEVTNPMTVHVNAIGVSRAIPAQKGSTVTEILQASIDAIRAGGGIPLINHPNFQWAFTAQDMLPLRNVGLIEIASGHPRVNDDGDGITPSSEQMWDQLLTAGLRIFGVAVDDVHNFREEFTIGRANPGRGWVVVRASALSREAILAGLNSGDFYASTGVTLKDIQSTPESLTVEIQPELPTQSSPKRHRILFIGKSGSVLNVSNQSPATYKFAGNEMYVRARIEDSGGRRAWTQPVFLTPP
ncbi:MAG: CehA/McbA family metallohydrolase [Acidobacteriota bacterium]